MEAYWGHLIEVAQRVEKNVSEGWEQPAAFQTVGAGDFVSDGNDDIPF